MSYAGMILRTVALTAVVSLCGVCFAQNSPNQAPSQEISSRIDAIVHRAAEPMVLSSPSSPARITSAQIFFNPDDVAEIQRYGPRAIPTLSRYILDRHSRIERVAIRLLGVIGGPEIVRPLLDVLDKSTSSGSRYEALLNLKQAPCTKEVARTILRVSQNDSDAIVGDQAREEVSWCSIESAPH